MKGFNGKLKSKDELYQYTKEQLIDMYWENCQNNDKFLDMIINATYEEFNEIKAFLKFARAMS